MPTALQPAVLLLRPTVLLPTVLLLPGVLLLPIALLLPSALLPAVCLVLPAAATSSDNGDVAGDAVENDYDHDDMMVITVMVVMMRKEREGF